MHPIIRNILAVVAGIAAGSIVNMGIIMISGSIIPPPEGADINSIEGLRSSMPLFTPRHFIFPFLAHALGALAGGAVAAYIAITHRMRVALAVGLFFLAGGIMMVLQLPSPLWFTVLDLGVAYIPMAWLGYKCAGSRN